MYLLSNIKTFPVLIFYEKKNIFTWQKEDSKTSYFQYFSIYFFKKKKLSVFPLLKSVESEIVVNYFFCVRRQKKNENHTKEWCFWDKQSRISWGVLYLIEIMRTLLIFVGNFLYRKCIINLGFSLREKFDNKIGDFFIF